MKKTHTIALILSLTIPPAIASAHSLNQSASFPDQRIEMTSQNKIRTITRTPKEMAQAWYPDIFWQEKSILTGDFTCHGKKEYALLGKKGSDAYVIVFQGGAIEKPEALIFDDFFMYKTSIKREKMEYTYEYLRENGSNEPRPSNKCSAIVLNNREMDPVHIYWDQATQSFSDWGL